MSLHLMLSWYVITAELNFYNLRMRNHSLKTALICISALVALLSMANFQNARSAVILSLVNASNTSSSTVTVTAGSVFTVSAYVTGPTASLMLDSFDVQLANLPSTITLNTITTPLQNWIIAPNLATSYSYGYANSTAYDRASDAILLNFNFSISPDAFQGVYNLSFSSSSAFNGLYSATGTRLAYTTNSMTVIVVPEPGIIPLLLLGAVTLLIRYQQSRRYQYLEKMLAMIGSDAPFVLSDRWFHCQACHSILDFRRKVY